MQDAFSIERMPGQSYEGYDGTQMEITFERNQRLRIYSSKARYSFLDLLANVGGLAIVLAFFIRQFISVWKFKSPQNFMVSSLFGLKRSAREDDPTKQFSHGADIAKIEADTFGFKEFICSCLPKRCSQRSRIRRALGQGRVSLEEETNMVQIVKNQRYFMAALKQLLSAQD